jgi:hypothetical protein
MIRKRISPRTRRRTKEDERPAADFSALSSRFFVRLRGEIPVLEFEIFTSTDLLITMRQCGKS